MIATPATRQDLGAVDPATIKVAAQIAAVAAAWAMEEYDSWMGEKLQTVIAKIPKALRAGSPYSYRTEGGFLRRLPDGKVEDATADFYKKMYAKITTNYAELVDEIDGDLCAKEPWWNVACAYASKESAGFRMANRFRSYAQDSGLPQYQQLMLRYYIFMRFQNTQEAKKAHNAAEKIKSQFVNEQNAMYAQLQKQQEEALAGLSTDKEMPKWLPFAIAGGVALAAAFVVRRKK